MSFFIVYSPQGEHPPAIHHQTHGAALNRAHRLAKKVPGRQFFVMKAASKPIEVAVEGGAA